jgi:OmpR family two-component system sensor histidine kinase YxdK
MKLFVREHIALIIFSLIQIFIVILVFWLDGYDRPLTALYAAFLGVFTLLGYLSYRYLTHSSFYAKLSTRQETLFPTKTEGRAPLNLALQDLLESQYRQFQYHLQISEKKQQDHTMFMNRWVHQMKTPLSVIELIIQDDDHPHSESIAEETERIKKGLNMALSISRLDTFQEDFYVQDISLFEIVNQVIQDNKRYLIHNYVYPEVHIAHDLMLTTDAKWLRFVIDQLLTNAIKYSAKSREKILITAFHKEQSVILEIRDHGVGIPATDLPRVFQPFFTGENGRDYGESTGIGLHLVKIVLDQLNHGIEIESEVDHGTIVRILFPKLTNV